MKIKTIDIKNFLALKQATLNLQAPINIITGANESGKSSIRDAIQWCLTGHARGLKTHDQQAALIRDGAKAAEVTLTLADGLAISRKKTPKTPASVTGPVPDDQVMASILCDPMAFLSLSDELRQQTLFKLIPGMNPTPEVICNKLADIIGQPFDEKTTALSIPEHAAIEQLGKLAATQGFKAAETEAIIKRRIAKRDRDDAKVEEPEPVYKTFTLPDIQQTEVEAGLSTLRTERDKLLQKRGKMEGELDKVPAMEQELGDLVSNPIEPPEDGEIKEWQDALDINRPILEKLQKQVESLSSGKAPQFYPETCPVFPGPEVPCPKAKEVGLPGREAPNPEKVKKLNADLQEQTEEIDRLEKGLYLAKAKQTAHDDYTKKLQELADKIAKMKEQQEQATATAGIDEQIATLDARRKTGYELLDAIRDFWRKKEAAEASQAKITEAEKEIALYDALAKALAPDGIPSALISEALGPVNQKLAFASGYLFPDCDEHEPLHLTEDLEVYRGITPYSTLSKSARYRVGIAFQVVLAQLAEARLIMVDECDILDPPNRSQLIDFLMAIRQDFDTILCFATSDHANPSPIPELQIWWIDNGKISPVTDHMEA